MIALSFLHPAILGGLALASIPIIIHILNRRRFKTMDWAAMEFLLKAAVRNRRRVRLENLLLLALRTLLVLLLVTAVARPFTQKEDSLATLFGSEGATERVILLDDSHSMRAGQGNRSAFLAGKQLVTRLIERLHEDRAGDRVTLVLGTRPYQGGEGIARVAVASSNYKKLVRALDGARASDGVFDVRRSIDAILDGYREKEARVVLHLVSDFRRRDWTAPDGSLHPEARQALARFADRGEVRLVDVGGTPVDNVGVIGLEPSERAVIAGVPATLVATVKNFGPGAAPNLQITFRFGNTTLTERIERTLQPNETLAVKMLYTFRSEGPAVASARVPTDVLPGDDERRCVVNVRRGMRFLLVDGEPDQEAYRSETDFLATALMPPGKTESGVRVDVVTEHTFSGRDLDPYDGVFLCNVYRLPKDRVAALEAYVKAGGGLVFFLGDQVDPQVYNTTFFGRGEKAGLGLLPLYLRDVEGSTRDYVHLGAPAPNHPVTRFLRGMNNIIFRTAAIKRFVRGEVPSRGNTRVILSYGDEEGLPAVAEKSFGDGRVLLFTTAADDEWSDLPRSPLYLMLLHETVRYVVRPDQSAATLPVGAPIVVPYDPTVMGPRVAVVPPPVMGGSPIKILSKKDAKTKALVYRYDRTDAAGIYTWRMRTPEGEPFQRPYAINVEPSEGDLRRADLSALEAMPGVTVERPTDEASLQTDESDRTEFWRTLVYLLIAVAALETLLAWRFGHHKKDAAKAEGKQVFVR
ncbi:MAG: BatA domain-containing protein [Planctomycetota bacterium]|nr:BatA domain-containing protein [Planctomycetota bacterium]